MIIQKIINNNIISAYDESGAEIVVMGRGIGFGKKAGNQVPDDRIEKVFRIQSHSVAEQLQELLANMPLEHVKVSSEFFCLCERASEIKVKSKHLCYIDRPY